MTTPNEFPQQPHSPYFDYAPVPTPDTLNILDPLDPKFGNPQIKIAPHNQRPHILNRAEGKWSMPVRGSEAQSIADEQDKAELVRPPFDYAPADKPFKLEAKDHNFGNPKGAIIGPLDSPHLQTRKHHAKTGRPMLTPATVKPGLQHVEQPAESAEATIAPIEPKAATVEKATALAVASTVEKPDIKPAPAEAASESKPAFKEIRSKEIVVDEEVINPKDRPVFLLARDENVIPGSNAKGKSLLYSDPSKQHPSASYYNPELHEFLPDAVSSLMSDREFARSGRIPPFLPGKGLYATDQEEKISFDGPTAPTLIQLHHPEAGEYSLLSLGIDVSTDLRGFFCFAAKGNQTAEQMFERAKAAYPELFDETVNTARHLGTAAMPLKKVRNIIDQIAAAESRDPESLSITIAPGTQEANVTVDQESIDSYVTEALKNFRQEQEAIARNLVDQFPSKVSGRPRYFQETIGSQLTEDYGAIMDVSFSLYKEREMDQDNPDIFDKLASALNAKQVWRLRKAERVDDEGALRANISELLDQLTGQELANTNYGKASGALKMLMDFGCFDLAHSGNTIDIERAINFIQSYSAAHPDLDVSKLDIDVAQEAIKYHAASMAADATKRVDLVQYDKEKRAKLDALADTTFRVLARRQRKAA